MIASGYYDLGLIIATATIGWAAISYSGYADTRGLASGRQFTADFSLLQLFAWVALIGSIALGAIFGDWWYFLVVLVMANILTRLLFLLFGQWSQVVIMVSIIPLLAGIAWRFLFK